MQGDVPQSPQFRVAQQDTAESVHRPTLTILSVSSVGELQAPPPNTGKKTGVLRLTLHVYPILSGCLRGIRLPFWTEKPVPRLHHN